MATFGGPTVPITLNIPAAQIPQVSPQQPQQPAADPTQQQPLQSKPQVEKKPSLPSARYYIFPWKQ
jgi:hypothetical protein